MDRLITLVRLFMEHIESSGLVATGPFVLLYRDRNTQVYAIDPKDMRIEEFRDQNAYAFMCRLSAGDRPNFINLRWKTIMEEPNFAMLFRILRVIGVENLSSTLIRSMVALVDDKKAMEILDLNYYDIEGVLENMSQFLGK